MANAVMRREQLGSGGSAQTQSIHRQAPEEKKELQGKYRDDQLRRRREVEKEEPI